MALFFSTKAWDKVCDCDKTQKQEDKDMSELKIEDTTIGTGDLAESGKSVSVHYTGKLEDGTVFDSSHKRGTPITFTLGMGQVIKGWDEGIAGLRVGGKRTLTIPSDMGYGAQGSGKLIPPHATLIFDVELMDVA